jgi:predicted transcriptional regulator YdeE
MQKTSVNLSEIKLVGISVRTSNAKEMNPETAKIPQTIHKYISENIFQKIKNKKNQQKLFCVYTEYENDMNGEYTYFVGEEVDNFDTENADLKQLTIKAQKYSKFTSQNGAMPMVCIDMWQKIWQMDAPTIGGERSYIADFEVYDERAIDPENTVLDIYIGLK